MPTTPAPSFMTLQSTVKVQRFKIEGHTPVPLRGRSSKKGAACSEFEFQVPVGLGNTGKFVARQIGGKADNKVILRRIDNLALTEPSPHDAPVHGIFLRNDGERRYCCGDPAWFVAYANQYDQEKKDIVQVVNLRTFDSLEAHVLDLCWFPDWEDRTESEIITRAGHPEKFHNRYDHYFVVQSLGDGRVAGMKVVKESCNPSWERVEDDRRRHELFMKRFFLQNPERQLALRRTVLRQKSTKMDVEDAGVEETVTYLPVTGPSNSPAQVDIDNDEEELVRKLQDGLDPVSQPQLTASTCCNLGADCPMKTRAFGGILPSFVDQYPRHYHWQDSDCRHGCRHEIHCAFESDAAAAQCIYDNCSVAHTCCKPKSRSGSRIARKPATIDLTDECPVTVAKAVIRPRTFNPEADLTDVVARDMYIDVALGQKDTTVIEMVGQIRFRPVEGSEDVEVREDRFPIQGNHLHDPDSVFSAAGMLLDASSTFGADAEVDSTPASEASGLFDPYMVGMDVDLFETPNMSFEDPYDPRPGVHLSEMQEVTPRAEDNELLFDPISTTPDAFFGVSGATAPCDWRV